MQGAKKGLIVNSRDLCGATNKAKVQFEGQNGRLDSTSVVVKAQGCKHKHKRHAKHGKR